MFMQKRETVGFVYFLAFTFLALAIFGGLGFYNGSNAVTGAATYSSFGDLGGSMEEILRLPFESIIAPFFTTVFGPDYYIYSIKILLIVVLSIIFGLGTEMIFKKNKKSARWIAIIFATLGVVLIPSGALEALFGTSGGESSFVGSLILSFIVLAFVGGIFYLLLLVWKNPQGMGENILRGVSFLSMILLISWALDTFNVYIDGGFFSLILSLITLICLIMFIVSLVKAFSGTARDTASATGSGLDNLRRTGGLRAQPRRIGNFFRDILGGNDKLESARANEIILEIKKRTNEFEIYINKIRDPNSNLSDNAMNLNNLRILLLNENSQLNKKLTKEIVSSFEKRDQNRIRDALDNLIKENNFIIVTVENYSNNRGIPTQKFIKLTQRGSVITLSSRLITYLNNRNTYISMLK